MGTFRRGCATGRCVSRIGCKSDLVANGDTVVPQMFDDPAGSDPAGRVGAPEGRREAPTQRRYRAAQRREAPPQAGLSSEGGPESGGCFSAFDVAPSIDNLSSSRE